MLRTTKNRGTGLRTTEGCHPQAGSYGGGISGMSYSRVKNEVLRLAQDDRCLDVILNEVIAEHPEHSEGRISPLRQSRTKPEILRA